MLDSLQQVGLLAFLGSFTADGALGYHDSLRHGGALKHCGSLAYRGILATPGSLTADDVLSSHDSLDAIGGFICSASIVESTSLVHSGMNALMRPGTGITAITNHRNRHWRCRFTRPRNHGPHLAQVPGRRTQATPQARLDPDTFTPAIMW